FKFPDGSNYNDIVRWMYDELFRLNIECDMISPYVTEHELSHYKVIVVPALYAASDALLERLNTFVERGGHIVYSFKSGFANEEVKVRTSAQPGLIEAACGVQYQMFVQPKDVGIIGGVGNEALSKEYSISTWMELLTPTTAEVLATYDHPAWSQYAAVTRNSYGQGTATYIGAKLEGGQLRQLLDQLMEHAGVKSVHHNVPEGVAVKTSYNADGQVIHFYLNYTPAVHRFSYAGADGVELISEQ